MLRALVLALFGVTYHFAFAFSGKTVGLTLVYFAAIYLLALGRSRRKIRRMKIHDLLYLDRQNEGVVIQQRRRRQGTFVLSLVLGVAGALLLMAGGLVLGLIGGVCIVLFSFGFFVSFASGVPAFFARRPGLKYRGQTLLVFRTLTAKLATMGGADGHPSPCCSPPPSCWRGRGSPFRGCSATGRSRPRCLT